MKKTVDWIILRSEFFAGGCFIGLLTYVPFLALLDYFVPSGKVSGHDNTIMIKWLIFCGIVAVFFTIEKKDNKF